MTEGDSLADAMARHPRAFSELSRSIVRAGGEGGFLEEALERIAKFTDQQAELKSRVMGALAYPIFLAVFGIGTLYALRMIGKGPHTGEGDLTTSGGPGTDRHPKRPLSGADGGLEDDNPKDQLTGDRA